MGDRSLTVRALAVHACGQGFTRAAVWQREADKSRSGFLNLSHEFSNRVLQHASARERSKPKEGVSDEMMKERNP
jgi:hypothetical protein